MQTSYTLVRHLDETTVLIRRETDNKYGITREKHPSISLQELAKLHITSWHSTIDAAVEAYANSMNS